MPVRFRPWSRPRSTKPIAGFGLLPAADAVVIERVAHQLVWFMTSTGDQIGDLIKGAKTP
jgi:hypothetical protein